MNKVLKKILITVLVLALICGLVYGGLLIYKKASTGPVNVYALDDFIYSDYWGDTAQTEGMVKTDRLQKVYVSDTQTVMEIYVTEGQQVKEGEPLLSFDTTLSDIDLQKAEIAHKKLEASLERAKKELETIKKLQPYTLVHIVPEPLNIEYIPEITPEIVSGTGTFEDPFYCLLSEEDEVDQALLTLLSDTFEELKEETDSEASEENPEVSDNASSSAPSEESEEDAPEEIYVALVTRENNALNAPILYSWGLCLIEGEAGFSFRYYEPVLSEEILSYEEEPADYYEEQGSSYTASEIAEMRGDQEEKIKNLEDEIKISQVELERLKAEINDGIVYAKLDGEVKNLKDPEECCGTDTALLEVSAGGGYYIEVAMGEFDLNTLEIGQEVTVESWETGVTCTGTVSAKSETPTTEGYSWSDGNSNVSYYPFTVFVDGENDLKENSWVSVSYEKSTGNEGSWYLESFFIRDEGGKRFVFLRGEDGKLEKRYISAGKDLWSSYTEIKGGIEETDYLAFPYGQDVAEGADTKEAGIEELYGY